MTAKYYVFDFVGNSCFCNVGERGREGGGVKYAKIGPKITFSPLAAICLIDLICKL